MCLKHVENGFASIKNENQKVLVFFPRPPEQRSPPPDGFCLPAGESCPAKTINFPLPPRSIARTAVTSQKRETKILKQR